MYQKITLFLFSILLILLLFFANKFVQIQDLKLEATQKSLLLGATLDHFIIIGLTISIGSWIIANLIVLKSERLFYIWIPLLFVVITSVLMSYFEEFIFDFNKQNNLSKGGFSISFIISGCIILLSLIIIEINYFALKYYFKNKIKVLNSKSDIICDKQK